VVDDYKFKIYCSIEVIEEVRKKDKDRLEQLRARVKSAWRSVKKLKEELDSWRLIEGPYQGFVCGEGEDEDEKERFANKIISLQDQLDQIEEFQDKVNQMLKDTYYRVWKTRGLAWMSDCPLVVAEIHKQILDNLTVEGRLSSYPSTNKLLVDSHFTVEELEVIQKGYELLA